MRGVSIIVPAYNSGKFFAATLESVLAQTMGDWELVVVNDGSTDQTGALAETFARRDKRIRVVHQANAGIAGARNRGFSESRADYEYCLFLDHDDVLEPEALEILLQALEQDQDAVAAHGLLRFIDHESKTLAVDGNYIFPHRRRAIRGNRRQDWPSSAPTTFAVLAYGNFVPMSGILMRRAAKAAVGDFDPQTEPADDWDLFLRLSLLGHIAFISKVVYAYRIHGGNVSRNRQLMKEIELHIRKKMYNSAVLNNHQKHLILIAHRYHERYRARLNFSYAVRKLSRGKRHEAFQHLRLAMRHILSSLKSGL